MENVCVIGLGYIGLPTASLLATKGFQVLGVDIKEDIISSVNAGEIHIFEPDLKELLQSAVNNGNLVASVEPQESDVFIITVPTPYNENREPNISYIESAVHSICRYLRHGNLIIIESTSPVGTTDYMHSLIKNTRPDLFFSNETVFIAYCPERVIPGNIIRELVENDRVIGGIDDRSTHMAKQFYSMFSRGELLLTNARTAELVKLSENAYRDVNIAFANELSLICDEYNINVWELISIANHHPRVNILQPGPGVGGHCIAVDPWFIVHSSPENSKLIQTARIVNDGKPYSIIHKIENIAQNVENPVIACFGLSYKPNTDDLRESPSIKIVEQIARKNAFEVLVIEPNIKQLPINLQRLDNVELTNTEVAREKANVYLMLVDHNEFRSLDKQFFENKVVVDSVGILERLKITYPSGEYIEVSK